MGSKMQVFCPRINILKEDHCILRIRGAPVRQKLGMILGNKLVKKLKLEKNGLLNWYSKMIFFLKKFRRFLTKKIYFESTWKTHDNYMISLQSVNITGFPHNRENLKDPVMPCRHLQCGCNGKTQISSGFSWYCGFKMPNHNNT